MFLLLVLLSSYICMEPIAGVEDHLLDDHLLDPRCYGGYCICKSGLCRTGLEGMSYGDKFSWWFPLISASLEFSPEGQRHTRVIWRHNDTTAETGRGRMENSRWVMRKLTQFDQGFYQLKDINGQVIESKKIEVSERILHLNMVAGSDLNITFNLEPSLSNVYYYNSRDGPIDIVIRGRLDKYSFDGRSQIWKSNTWFQFMIHELKTTDSGSFHLKDPDDNPVLTVYLIVTDSALPWFPIGVAVGIPVVLVLCCCCVRRCCCKKSSTKTDSSGAQTAAAPDLQSPVCQLTYNHDNASGAAGPKYFNQPPAPTRPTPAPARPSQSAGWANSSGPSYSFLSPLVHHPTDVNVTSPQPAVPGQGAAPAGPIGSQVPGQGAAPAGPIGSQVPGQGAAPAGPIGSDFGPRFELKGVTFPSAPPLGSDVSMCDVYTSDKLNFD